MRRNLVTINLALAAAPTLWHPALWHKSIHCACQYGTAISSSPRFSARLILGVTGGAWTPPVF
ncbi:MAG: hypothetical protein ACKVKF_02830 [Rhodobacterales bacterium]|uniref:hypothetical protein n=1 Tax=Puniceibacterium antarcticum TaxID=1206336 RepID=UPI00117B5D55|nr:hypothetical protein [Puniceibacterium antarcticum]